MTVVGNTKRVSASILVDDELTDPDTLTFLLIEPDTGETEYVYGTDVELVRDSLGEFHFDLVPTLAGIYFWRWTYTTPELEDTLEGELDVVGKPVDVTIQVRDPDADPVTGVLVTLLKDGAILKTARSSPVGDVGDAVLRGVTPGTYIVTGSKARTSTPETPIEVVDSGGVPQVFPLVTTPQTVTLPAATPTCVVFGVVRAFDGVSAADVRVVVEVSGGAVAGSSTSPAVHPEHVFIPGERFELRTDSDGFWQVTLPHGAKARVRLPETRFEKSFRVPVATLINIRDVRQELGQSDVGVNSDITE